MSESGLEGIHSPLDLSPVPESWFVVQSDSDNHDIEYRKPDPLETVLVNLVGHNK